MSRKRKRLEWDEWRQITKKIYLQRFRGWPAAEMKRYYESGMSPAEAYDKAAKGRLRACAWRVRIGSSSMSTHLERFKRLPKYSFVLGRGGGVQRVVDTCGNWIERHEAAQIIEAMDDEIQRLNSVILALKGQGLRVVQS